MKRSPAVVVHLRMISDSSCRLRASSLLHLDLEPDALSLDDDPPRLDTRDAERCDDVAFSHKLSVYHRFRLRAHHRALQLQLRGFGLEVGDLGIPLVSLI